MYDGWRCSSCRWRRRGERRWRRTGAGRSARRAWRAIRRSLTTVRRDEGTTELTYAVYRAAFGGDSEHIGEIQALARPGLHGNYSPARWMVVAETPDGFVLRGEGLSTFKLPASIWNPAESGGGNRR